MRRTVNIWANLDWVTVFIYLLLIFLGWLNIYAAVYSEEHNSIFDIDMRYGKQLLWIGAAIIIALSIMMIDTRFYTFFAYVIFAIALISLLGVAFLGKEVNGARSWFDFGGFLFQPTEFAKVATCMALAKYLSSFQVKLQNIKSLIIVGLIIASPVFLIMLQPDFGSVIVYISLVFVLYREGFPGEYLFFGFVLVVLFVLALLLSQVAIILFTVILSLITMAFLNRRFKEPLIASIAITIVYFITSGIVKLFHSSLSLYFIIAISVGAVAVGAAIYSIFKRIPNLYKIVIFIAIALTFTFSIDYVFNNFLEKHQRQRVNILLGKESDPRGAEYNVNQSKIAIGSGGFLGKGFLQGTQTKYNFVPEQSTDFIFCTVGEEWGFLGSFFVIALFFALLVRLIYLAERQRSAFSRIYGYGVVSIMFFHVAINVGMTIGVLPVIGIPLPFFSYGGSSLWAFTMLLFIFLRLDASRLELLK
jgi:rod shape determining protein RodA